MSLTVVPDLPAAAAPVVSLNHQYRIIHVAPERSVFDEVIGDTVTELGRKSMVLGWTQNVADVDQYLATHTPYPGCRFEIQRKTRHIESHGAGS